MKPVRLLEEIKRIKDARNSRTARLLFGSRVSSKQALLLKLQFPILFLLGFILIFSFVPDLATTGDFQNLIESIFHRQHLVFNTLWIVIFFYGLLNGADLLLYTTISENLRYLSLPILIKDMVRFRMKEVFLRLLKFLFYAILPCYTLLYLSRGISLYATFPYLVIVSFTYLTAFTLGLIIIFILAKGFPRVTTDHLFVRVFLTFTWSSLILFKLSKRAADHSLLVKTLAVMDRFFSNLFFTGFLETTFLSQAPSVLRIIFIIIVLSVLVYSLLGLAQNLLDKAYRGIHFNPSGHIMDKGEKPRPGFKKVYKILGIIPAQIRLLLARDITLFLRKPYSLLKLLFFILFVAGVAMYYKGSLVAAPKLLFIYLFPSLMAFRLFIHAVGHERSNILLIKQLYPSPLSYLNDRFRVNFLVSSIIVIPILILFILANPQLLSAYFTLRLLFIISSFIFSVMLLTGYSAAFAQFDEDELEQTELGIHPGASVFSLLVGSITPLFFYFFDSYFLVGRLSTTLLTAAKISGLTALLSALLFLYLGIKKIAEFHD